MKVGHGFVGQSSSMLIELELELPYQYNQQQQDSKILADKCKCGAGDCGVNAETPLST